MHGVELDWPCIIQPAALICALKAKDNVVRARKDHPCRRRGGYEGMRVFVAIGMRMTGTARAPVVIVIARIGTVLWRNSYLLRQTICRIISSRSVERILGKPKGA